MAEGRTEKGGMEVGELSKKGHPGQLRRRGVARALWKLRLSGCPVLPQEREGIVICSGFRNNFQRGGEIDPVLGHKKNSDGKR